jgi:hypothetical protein
MWTVRGRPCAEGSRARRALRDGGGAAAAAARRLSCGGRGATRETLGGLEVLAPAGVAFAVSEEQSVRSARQWLARQEAARPARRALRGVRAAFVPFFCFEGEFQVAFHGDVAYETHYESGGARLSRTDYYSRHDIELAPRALTVGEGLVYAGCGLHRRDASVVLRPQGALPALLPAQRLAGSGVPGSSPRAAPPELMPFAARADFGFQRLLNDQLAPVAEAAATSCLQGRPEGLFSPREPDVLRWARSSAGAGAAAGWGGVRPRDLARAPDKVAVRSLQWAVGGRSLRLRRLWLPAFVCEFETWEETADGQGPLLLRAVASGWEAGRVGGVRGPGLRWQVDNLARFARLEEEQMRAWLPDPFFLLPEEAAACGTAASAAPGSTRAPVHAPARDWRDMEDWELLQLAGPDSAALGRAALKVAFRRQAFQWHPDRCASDAKRAEHAERFKRVQAAFEHLVARCGPE